jgi:hypothetical protein
MTQVSIRENIKKTVKFGLRSTSKEPKNIGATLCIDGDRRTVRFNEWNIDFHLEDLDALETLIQTIKEYEEGE